jgi:hypothetical protein
MCGRLLFPESCCWIYLKFTLFLISPSIHKENMDVHALELKIKVKLLFLTVQGRVFRHFIKEDKRICT